MNTLVVTENIIPNSGYNTIAAASGTGLAALKGKVNDAIITSTVPGCHWGIGSLIVAPAYRDGMTVRFIGTPKEPSERGNCEVAVITGTPFDEPIQLDLSECGLLTSLTIQTDGGTQNPLAPFNDDQVALQLLEIVVPAIATNDPHLIGRRFWWHISDGHA